MRHPAFDSIRPSIALLALVAACRSGPEESGARPPGDAEPPGYDPAAATSIDPDERHGGEPDGGSALDWSRLYGDGLIQLQEGRLVEAWESLRTAALLRPRQESSAAALGEAADRLYASLVEAAEEDLDRNLVSAACERLRFAARVEPVSGGPVEAERLLARYGYEPYGAEWVHREDAILREKREERIAERRRRELELGPEFRLERRRDIRVFTDVRDGDVTPPVVRLVEELRVAYASIFLPLGTDLIGPGDGVDIVLYSRREDYELRTGSSTTLGMFLPKERASFFFFRSAPFGRGKGRENIPVLLHEVCHQLDDRVLGMRVPPPWLQEGLAVFFETARIGADYRIESFGEIPWDLAQRMRRATSPDGDRWWGVERLVGTASLDGIHGTEDVHDFYAQAALLVGYLLGDRDGTRELFYELVGRARRPGARPESAWSDFRQVLGARGETPVAFDSRWRRASQDALAELMGDP